jgi:ABC-2 type transport system ATP-binding protein
VTIVLVTHYTEEAERLCDRVALIDRGAVVAIGSPAGLRSGPAAASGCDSSRQDRSTIGC